MKILFDKKLIYNFIKLFILISGFLSLSKAIINALYQSIDFQYSPAVMTWQNINHYNYILNGGQRGGLNDPIMLTQNGEYGHGLYVLMYPFTLLDWNTAKIIWLIFNVFLSFFIPIFLCKKNNLNKNLIFLSLFLFLASTPARSTIGNGQLSFLVLATLILPFLYKSEKAIILSGFSYLKYNTGYLLFLYFFLTKNYKKLFYSSIIFVVGWLTYSFITNTNLIECLYQPLKVTFYIKTTSELIYGFSFLKFFFVNNNQLINLILLFLSIFFSIIFLNLIKNIKEVFLKISLFCLTILIFSPHRIYDYILLFPLMVYSLKNFKNSKIKIINLVFIFYIFYGLRFMKTFGIEIDTDLVINITNILIFSLLFLINYLDYNFNNKKKYIKDRNRIRGKISIF